MAYTKPTVADFKAYFVRDFPYGSDPATTVLDSDITKAQGQASFNTNDALFADQAQFDIGFNYLTAHYLCIDFQASAAGIFGTFNWPEQSKSVGSVSQSFAIPTKMMDNPFYNFLTKTPYGAKFLMLIYPSLIGPVVAVAGRTHA